MALSAEFVSSLIDDLYEAAASPDRWTHFLERLRNFSQASKAYFLLIDPEQRCDLSRQVGYDEDFAAIYARDWMHQDIVLKSFVEIQQRSGGDWVGDRQSVLNDYDFFSSSIFNDFVKPDGDIDICAAALSQMEGGIQGGIAMRRSTSSQPFSQDVLTLLTILSPHMKRALSLHRTFSRLQDEGAALAGSVEAFDIPMMSITSTGKVCQISAAARQILSRADGLILKNSRLFAQASGDDAALQSLLHGAIATGAGRGTDHPVKQSRMWAPQTGKAAGFTPAFGGSHTIRRSPPAPPLHVIVTPFKSSHVLLDDRPSALVF